MVSRKLIVKSSTGMHMEPAELVAKTAESCDSKIEIRYKNHIINAKSMLNLLSPGIPYGAEIELRCTGKNEMSDMERMLEVIRSLHDEADSEQVS